MAYFDYDAMDRAAKEAASEAETAAVDYLTNFDPKGVLKHPAFLQDLRDVYRWKNESFATDSELVDRFFNDRNWGELNTFKMIDDLAESLQAPDDIRAKMKRVQQVYNQYPSMFSPDGRPLFDVLADVVPAALLDPFNVIPGGKALVAGRQAVAAGKTVGAAARAGAKTGAISEAAINVGAAGVQDALIQARDISTGLQDEFSGGQLALNVGVGGVLGAGVGGAIGAVAGAMGGQQARAVLHQIDQLRAQRAAVPDGSPEAAQLDAQIEGLNSQLTGLPPAPPTQPAAEADPAAEAPAAETPAAPMGDPTQLKFWSLRDTYDAQLNDLESQHGFGMLTPSEINARATGDEDFAKDWSDYQLLKTKIGLVQKHSEMPNILVAKRAKLAKAIEGGNDKQVAEISGEIASLTAQYNNIARLDGKGIDRILTGLAKQEAPGEGGAPTAATAGQAGPDVATNQTPSGETQAAPSATPAKAPEAEPTTAVIRSPGDPLDGQTVQVLKRGQNAMRVRTADGQDAIVGRALIEEPTPDVETEPDFDYERAFESDPANADADPDLLRAEIDEAAEGYARELVEKFDVTSEDELDLIVDALYPSDPDELPGLGQAIRQRSRDLLGDIEAARTPDDGEGMSDEDALNQLMEALGGGENRAADVDDGQPKPNPIRDLVSKYDLDALTMQDREAFISGFQRMAKAVFDPASGVSFKGKLTVLQRYADRAYERLIETSSSKKAGGAPSRLGKDDITGRGDGERPEGYTGGRNITTDLDGTKRLGSIQGILKGRLPTEAGDATLRKSGNFKFTDEMKAEGQLKKAAVGRAKPSQDTDVVSVITRVAPAKGAVRNGKRVVRFDKGDMVVYDPRADRFSVLPKAQESTPQTSAAPSGSVTDQAPAATEQVPNKSTPDFSVLDPIARIKAATQARMAGTIDDATYKRIVSEGAAEAGVAPKPAAPAPAAAATPAATPASPAPKASPRTPDLPDDQVQFANGTPPPVPAGHVRAIRNVANPLQVRVLSAGQQRDGAGASRLLGRGNPAEWEAGFVPAGVTGRDVDAPNQFLTTSTATADPTPAPDTSGRIGDLPPLASDLENAEVVVGGKTMTFAQARHRLESLESRRFLKNTAALDQHIAELEELYRALPEYRLPTQGRLDALKQLETIMGGYGPEQGALVRDLLRRISAGTGDRLPMMDTASGRNAYGVLAGVVRADSSGSMFTMDAAILGHELAHWAYRNVLSVEDRLQFWQAMRKYYAADGTFDWNKVEEALARPLESQRAKRDGLTGKVGNVDATEAVSEISPQEFFANQFEQWMLSNGKMPYAEGVWRKMARIIEGLIARFFDRSRIDPDLEPLFAKILPDAAVERLRGTKAAETPKGKVFEAATARTARLVRGIEARLNSTADLPLADVANNMHLLARFAQPQPELDGRPFVSQDAADAIAGILRDIENLDLDTAIGRLDAGNRLVDAFEIANLDMAEQFRQAEAGHIRPADNPVEVVPRAVELKTNLAIQAFAKREEITNQIKALTEEWGLAVTAEEMKAVVARLADLTFGLAKFRMLDRVGRDGKRTAALRGWLGQHAQHLYDASGSTRNADAPGGAERISYYANLPQDRLAAELSDLFDGGIGRMKGATDRLTEIIERAEKKAARDAGIVAEQKVERRGTRAERKARKTADARRSAEPAPDTPADAQIRTIDPKALRKEVLRNAGNTRAADLGAELIRRARAEPAISAVEVPKNVFQARTPELQSMLEAARAAGDVGLMDAVIYEAWRRSHKGSAGPLKLKTQTVQKAVNKEASEYTGLSPEDGVPANAPDATKELVRRITHRDVQTQRVARSIAYRLDALAGGLDAEKTARLVGRTADAGEALDFRGEAWGDLRNKIRALAKAMNGTGQSADVPADVIVRDAVRLVTRAGTLSDTDDAAIIAAYRASRDKIKATVNSAYINVPEAGLAQEWFARHVIQMIGGGATARRFTGPSAASVLSAAERMQESVAFLTNGLIGRADVKQALRQTTWYGDLFNGAAKIVSLGRDRLIARFVGSGLGRDPDSGLPITFLHATPNGRVFDDDGFVWQPGGAENYNGPGIYLGHQKDRDLLEDVYGHNPTESAMLRVVQGANLSDGDRQNAELLVSALWSARRHANDARAELTELEARGGITDVDANDDVSAYLLKEIYGSASDADAEARLVRQIEAMTSQEEAILETLEEMGVEFTPRVVESYVRILNPFDFRMGTEYTLEHPDVRLLLEGLEDLEAVSPHEMRHMRGLLGGSFDGTDLYTFVADAVAESNGLDADAAKRELTKALMDLGYDGLQGTVSSRVSRIGAREVAYDTIVAFESHQVKSVDARAFNPNSEFFNEAARVEVYPVGGLVQAVAEGTSMSPENAAAWFGVAEAAGAKETGILRKLMGGKRLTPDEGEKLRRASPFHVLSNNAVKLRDAGMHWLADWAKPEQGTGFHEREMAATAAKVVPLIRALQKVSGESGVSRWARSLKFAGKVSQPAVYTDIVKSLRRPESWGVKNLPAAAQPIARAIRTSFEMELEKMKDAGLQVGKVTNYFPQIWDAESIRRNGDRFRVLLAEYLMRESRDPMSMRNKPMDRDAANEVAQGIMNRLLDDDGVYLPHMVAQQSRGVKADHIDYGRMIRLNELDDKGALKFGDLLDAMEKEGFLVDDLQSVVAKYFETSTRRIEFANKFGVNNHAFYDYLAVMDGGAEAAVKLLTSNKILNVTHRVPTDDGVFQVDTRVPHIMALSEDTARKAVDNLVAAIAAGKTSRAGAKKHLMDLKPNTPNDGRVRAYEKRVEAIANALFENGGKGFTVAPEELRFADSYFNALQGKPVGDGPYHEIARDVSKGLRTFNSVSLLGFTMLTSLSDVALPLLRGAKMTDAIRGVSSYMADQDYRQAIQNIGASIENILHSRMAMLYGSSGGRVSNAFFNATLLTPWTNMMREYAAVAGYEMLKAEARRAHRNFRPGQVGQNRAYRKAHRILKEFGLEEYAVGNKTLDDLTVLYKDDRVRAALHKFANESIFTPDRTDVPLWAQTPWGAVFFQLKSYPLMFGRLAGTVLNKAGRAVATGGAEGDIWPLINMLTIGTGMGGAALYAKDHVQLRGGEDERSFDTRERSFTKIAAEFGYDAQLHGPVDEFLGWYLEGFMSMGGLGLLGDLFHSISAQTDNGLYGATRIMSAIGGPTVGTALSGITVAQGGLDALFDRTPTSDAPERAAARELATRVPILGGVRDLRETAADTAGTPARRGGGGFGGGFEGGGFSGGFKGGFQ